MSTLARAIQIAVTAHGNIPAKCGEPFIMHPLRVMMAVPQEPIYQIVAVLHDVVEDTDVTLDTLRTEGFCEQVIGLVGILTKREDQTYRQFIEDIAKHPMACVIKKKDIEDNLKVQRNLLLNPKNMERIHRYMVAWHALDGYPWCEFGPEGFRIDFESSFSDFPNAQN